MKTRAILMTGLLLVHLTVFAQDDVSIDSGGNVRTGVSNSNGNLEVTGTSGEHGVVGKASGSGAAGLYGINTTSGNYGILGYDSYGVYGYSLGGDAGYFQGNAHVTGNLIVNGSISGLNLGDITGVTAGTGLTGGGLSGDVTISADTAYLQRRVVGTCTGQVMAGINADGTVSCDTDDVGLTSESDPKVGSITLNYVPKWNGTALVTGTIYDNGNVGIGLSNPDSRLHLVGGNWDLTNTEGDFKIGNTAYRMKIGIATGGGGAGDVRIRAHGGTNRLLLGGGTNDVLTVTDSRVGVGTFTPSSTLTVAGMIESTSGGVKFPDGTVLISANMPPPLQNPHGNTITAVDTFGTVGGSSSITIGADTLPVISYYDGTNGHLKVLKCGNASCSSGNTATTVDSTNDVGSYTSITIGTDGLPVIAYYDVTNGDLKVAKCGNGSCSSGNTITTVDSANDVGVHLSITIASDGLPIISYSVNVFADLKALKCGNASCSSGNYIITLDSADAVGPYSSITIGTDGLPIISYSDYTNSDLKVVKCGNASCSAGSGTIRTTVDSVGFVGLFTSITIGADGLPVISYYDSGNTDLKVLKCGNASCSAGNTVTTVDSIGTVGLFTSITIGMDGLPFISYRDDGNGNLKVLKCGNAACSSGNTITTPDSAGNVGSFTSTTIGTDGLPVISYYDSGTADLKVLKCANQFCLNNWVRR